MRSKQSISRKCNKSPATTCTIRCSPCARARGRCGSASIVDALSTDCTAIDVDDGASVARAVVVVIDEDSDALDVVGPRATRIDAAVAADDVVDDLVGAAKSER